MASHAPVPAEQPHLRPSFAKVAASALKPSAPKEASPKPRPPVATPRNLALPQTARPMSANGEAPNVPVARPEMTSANDKAGSTAVRTGEWTDAAVQSAAPSSDIKNEGSERPRSITFAKVSVAEDSSTQLSSSDGSGKPPSIDGKSVASATTFALDEKESLRPDDSASLRAVEEEDVTSPPDSVTADSRQGSDNGIARAFRDQLHEIAVMNPQPHRGVPPGRFPTLPNGTSTLYDPNQPQNGARPMSQPVVSGMPMMNGGPIPPAIPDEKLLQALQSPRDRLFIVKLEQDFIDFIKEPRESEWALPSCNSFYRLLAHRLAAYYLLGHELDQAKECIKITRTPYCRIPPPMSQMGGFAKGTSTPPVELPTRKIMRRDDGKSGTNTTANSQNPSKTTSEVGGSEGSNDDKDKDKAAMTREEREARYKEARQRIFGSAEGEENDIAETSETAGSGDEKDKDPSRSSSAAGKKKNSKKQRNYDDDDFQARSRYNVYYPQQYPVPGYSSENGVYYNGFPGPMPNPQYQGMNPGASPPTSYNNTFPAMTPPDGQAQYGWSGQPYQPPNSTIFPNYGPMQNGYDPSTDFQRMSFQNPNVPSQVTPKMGNIPMASYQDSYQQPPQMPVNPGWSQMPQQTSYPISQGPYAQPGPGNRPMSAPHQGPMPTSYPYGQFPTNPYNGKPNHNQHPIPGSYNRQQFNPQSQAFIPGNRNMPYQMQPSMNQGPPPMNGYSNFQIPGPNGLSHQMSRPSPSVASTPSFGSPQGNGSAGSMHRNLSQPGDPSLSQSSIAKYGTPSHLPAKPPAPVPVAQIAPKLPSMARIPSTMGPTLVSSTPVVPLRGSGVGNNN
ncbi:hypothetical protein GQ44DRAFT_768648 [Phaeosphaeriaceae sp. PMI808]|nr:hypothetical protein GQ44DRAFT_768648 [Phaeosphaeriaceae sp. PMI808]